MINNKRKRRTAVRIIAAIAFVIAAIAAYLFLPRKTDYQIPDASRWRTGDIFFSTGNTWESRAVRLLGGSDERNTSHCGFVLMQGGKPMLVHMSTDKGEITMESVEAYGELNDSKSVRAMRLKQMPDTIALRTELEKELAGRRKFDSSFDMTEEAYYYCTELIIKVLQRIDGPKYPHAADTRHVYPHDIEKWSGLQPIP